MSTNIHARTARARAEPGRAARSEFLFALREFSLFLLTREMGFMAPIITEGESSLTVTSFVCYGRRGVRDDSFSSGPLVGDKESSRVVEERRTDALSLSLSLSM